MNKTNKKMGREQENSQKLNQFLKRGEKFQEENENCCEENQYEFFFERTTRKTVVNNWTSQHLNSMMISHL